MATKRVVFTFDEPSLTALQTVVANGNLPSMAEAVKRGLALLRAFQDQKKEGFTEIRVRNPRTNEERILVADKLV